MDKPKRRNEHHPDGTKTPDDHLESYLASFEAGIPDPPTKHAPELSHAFHLVQKGDDGSPFDERVWLR